MRILFIRNDLAPFTQIDLEILRSAHDVRDVYMRHDSLRHLIRGHLSVLRGVLWADMLFAWFGAFHALVPFLVGRLLNRRCIVVASGYDVANLPEIDYGNMRPGLRKVIGQWVFHLANKILAVSEFATREVIRNAGVSPQKVETICHGVPLPSGLDIAVVHPKSQQVLTVGNVNWGNLSRKGLETFVRSAKYLPEVPFILIGPFQDEAINHLRRIASPNVQFLGPIYGPQLSAYMKDSAVYVQVSAYESFGMSLAEAMLCQCFPVVTDRAAIPEVVGDTGIYALYGDPQATALGILCGLSTSELAKQRCQHRIISRFSMEERRKRLLESIES